MIETTNQQPPAQYLQPTAQGPQPSAVVLRVREGLPAVRQGPADYSRSFCVVLDRLTEDLAVVASAADPETGTRIPRPGEGHPGNAEYAARPPMIFPVGVREKDGPMIASRSRLYNVRVRYVAKEGRR